MLRTLVYSADPDQRKALMAALRGRGHRVLSCATVVGGRRACTRYTFDLAVLHWREGDGSAVALCRRIREDTAAHQPFILAVVPVELPGHVADAIECGVDDFVRAPLDPGVLALRLGIAERRIADRTRFDRGQEALRESERRFTFAALGANDGLWDWNLATNEIFFSHRWKAILGWGDEEVGTDPEEWFGRVHPDDLPHLRAVISAHLAGETATLENEHRMRHRDGEYRWMLVRGIAVCERAGPPTRVAGSQTDITERKLAEERLTYNAFHDSLTGLPNRALFMDRLGLALARASRRDDLTFAVLFLDLDRFKLVNDSLGHAVGDQLLAAISRRLEATLRPGDTVARFGGDEFALLLEDIKDAKDATMVAERIHADLRKPFDLDGQEVFSNASIGIAMGSLSYERPEEVVRDADTAMYRAKTLGRNRFAVFDRPMHDRVVAALRIENELRRAVERSEFTVYYQPIVSLESGRLVGFEALVRWQHPQRGLVLPAEFIPVAEETGMIVPIDSFVLQTACRQARAWKVQFRSEPALTMSVNVSGVQFMQPDLIMQIDHILRTNGLYGQTLKLEITESVFMEHARFAGAMLEHLRGLAIRLSIDDFGTGYSSLSYLRRFEIDTLKIDASFVGKIADDDDSSEIVRTIVTLARNLGKDMVAEGIETAAQLARLRELKCKFGQGNFFSKPLDSEAATRLLASDPRW